MTETRPPHEGSAERSSETDAPALEAPAPGATAAGAGVRVVVFERAEPLPPAKRTAPERLAELGGDVAFALRRGAGELWDDFRHRDRWFRWKAAILSAWVALSVLSFRVATAGPADPAANALEAYVAVTGTSMSWALLLENRSDEAWTGVRVIVDDAWTHERAVVGPREKVVIGPQQLRRGDEEAPAELEVRSVLILTDGGQASPQVVR